MESANRPALQKAAACRAGQAQHNMRMSVYMHAAASLQQHQEVHTHACTQVGGLRNLDLPPHPRTLIGHDSDAVQPVALEHPLQPVAAEHLHAPLQQQRQARQKQQAGRGSGRGVVLPLRLRLLPGPSPLLLLVAETATACCIRRYPCC